MGPCLCGDTCCPSCGPAQGYSKCPNCGRWDSEGPCDDPAACEAACKEIAEGEAKDYLIEKLMQRESDQQDLPFWEMDIPPEKLNEWRAMTYDQLNELVQKGG
ncbi:hypothetical protein CMI47_10130 [Candidatus Pacearchaeota archaeon]|nr:hypothetical protein [Candidatus Pacearchaeota archaeon]|tara:strand:- start:4109 stop:4417 length:309 start_codon:yes stop_codon:yes gene_type:complete